MKCNKKTKIQLNTDFNCINNNVKNISMNSIVKCKIQVS